MESNAPSQEVHGVSIPTKAPSVSDALNTDALPPFMDFLDNEESIRKARRVLSAKLDQHKADRDDLEDQWEDFDMMWTCGRDATRRAAAQTDYTEATCGSTLFYRQVRTLAALDVDVVLGNPDSPPVRYAPTHIENIPFSAHDAEYIAAQRQALLRYTMKVDNWEQKFIEGDFMLTKYGNQPVMMWWRRRIDNRWFKTPQTDESGKIIGSDWEKREVVIEDHPELVFPPNENFYVDRHISDIQRQQAIFFEQLQDITEIWAGAIAGEYRNVEEIEQKHRYAGDNVGETDLHTAKEENRGLDSGDDTQTGSFKLIHCWAKLPIGAKGKWDEKSTPPRWCFLTFVDNISDGPCLRATENPDPDNEFPGFIWRRNPDDSDMAYHIADGTVLKTNWDEATTRKNQYLDNLSAINRRPILSERGNASTNDLIYGASRVINVENINGTREMDVKDTSNSFLQCLEYIDSDSNRAVGTDAPITGQPLGSRTSASEATNVYQSASRPHNVLIKYHIKQFLPWYARKVQRFWELCGDPDRILAITDQKEMIRVDLGHIFGEFDVETTCIGEFENDLVSNQNLAFVMQAVIPNFMDVMGPEGKRALLAKILEHYKVNIEDAMPEYDDTDSKLVAYERLMNMLENGIYEEPIPGENHAAHLKMAEGTLLRYQGVNDEIVAARLELVKQYVVQLKQMMEAGRGTATGGSPESRSQNATPGQVVGNAIAGSSPASLVGNLPLA